MVAAVLSIFLLFFKVYAALVPTLIMAGLMLLAAQSSPQSPSAFRRYLAARPLSYWVMTWFLFELVGAYRHRHIFPRAGLVLGVAVARVLMRS